jgi:hypothetical protein
LSVLLRCTVWHPNKTIINCIGDKPKDNEHLQFLPPKSIMGIIPVTTDSFSSICFLAHVYMIVHFPGLEQELLPFRKTWIHSDQSLVFCVIFCWSVFVIFSSCIFFIIHSTIYRCTCTKKSLKIPKGCQTVHRRRTNNTMVKRNRSRWQTLINKILHRKLKIDQSEFNILEHYSKLLSRRRTFKIPKG